MPWLVAALLSGLVQIAGAVVGRVLLSLGSAVITYTGFSASLTWLKTSAVTAAVGLGPEIVGLLSVLKVGPCISMVFSAMLARLVVTGLQGDRIKKWVTK